MTVKFTAQRAGFGFFPNSAGYQEDMLVIPQHKDLVLTVKMARNPAQLRFFHAMCRRMILAGYWDKSQEELREWFKFAAGHYKTIITETGEPFYIAKHLNEESMDKIEFTSFLRACKKAAAERLSCDIDSIMGETFVDAGPYERR